MSLIAAAQLTAIATAVLAVFAVVTAWYARRAFLKQSQEVRDQGRLIEIQAGQLDAQRGQLAEQQALSSQQTEVLTLQAQELRESLAQREREAAERHRAQAARVYITETRDPGSKAIRDPSVITGTARPPVVLVAVDNSSEQPVYAAELRWHRGHAWYGEPDPVGVIMPGARARRDREFEPDTPVSACGAVVRFTDASGVRWLRKPDGTLTEIEPGPRAPAG